MNNVLKHQRYTVNDTDAENAYKIYRSSKIINDDFKKNVSEYITEDMGIYLGPNRKFYYVRWDEKDKKYYTKNLNIRLSQYNKVVSQTQPNWTPIKNALTDNPNIEYEAIPDTDDLLDALPNMELTSELIKTEEDISQHPNDISKQKEKSKYSETEIEKYNKFVQEFNMMMSEEYSRSFRTKKYNELMKKLKEDAKLLEMLQDEIFSGDEGKNILNTMNKIYNKWKER